MPRFLVLLVLAGASVGFAADPPKSGSTPEQLIKELGDPDFAVRERAFESLRAMGSAAIPVVERALKSDTPEIRRRAAELLPILKSQAALEPRRVTLKAGAAKLPDTLAEVSKQTGYSVVAEDAADGERAEVAIAGTSFWEAIERVAERSNRAVDVAKDEDGIRLTRSRARSPFVAFDGAFRIELVRLHEDRDIDFSKHVVGGVGDREHKLTLKLSVMAEPRFTILMASPAQITEAVDDKDGKMPPAPREDRRNRVLDPDDMAHAEFQIGTDGFLRRSPKLGTKLRTLVGTATVRVVVERKRVVISNYRQLMNQEIKVGNETLIVRSAKIQESGELYVSLQIPPKRDDMDERRWHQRVIIEDMWGKRLRPHGHGSGQSGGVYHIDQWCQMPGGLFNTFSPNLVIEDWVILDKQVRFAFKDVPLP
jgi:hypothetical protein